MKKKLLVALSSTLAIAMALPAFAKDHSINGFYRVRFMQYGQKLAKDMEPNTLVDQRARFKWTMGLNEYVSVTYYGEVDMQYGDAAYGGARGGAPGSTRNQGGAIGGDTVNLETKNLYVNVKVPDTPVSARVGLQGFGDNWDLVFVGADMAGVKVSAKLDAFNVTGIWSKWQEGSAGGDSNEDDVDFWGLQVGLKPVQGLKLGVDGYYINANGDGSLGIPVSAGDDLYYLGVNAAYKLPQVNLKAWAFYNFGTMNAEGDEEADVSGWAASIKGTTSLAGAKVGLRLFYFSGDDDAADGDVNSAVLLTTAQENFPFYMDNLMLLTPDATWTTIGSEGYGFNDAQAAGYGLWGAILSTSYVPPTMKQAYAKVSVGYMAAVEDDRNTAGTKREGNSLGTEIAARVGYKVAEIVDVSLNGSILSLGDFFDKQAGGEDPDNPYVLYAMVNVGF